MSSAEGEVAELVAPLAARTAVRFGVAHASSVIDQAVRGLPRTLPVWIIPATAVTYSPVGPTGFARARIGPGATRRAGATIVIATALQCAWTCGFATVAGVRTAYRLARLTSENMIPIEITGRGPVPVRASVHYARLGSGWYVDGVFAWPRKRGGGKEVVSRLLARADAAGVPLTLTALSPRVAAGYRAVGFRDVVWIYFMRRQPVPPAERRRP